MADADSFSVHEVATHQLPLTTKPVRTSEDISYSGNSQHDYSNNIGNDEVSHSASRDFATFNLHYVPDSGKGGNDIIDNSLYCVSFLMTNGEEDLYWGNK